MVCLTMARVQGSAVKWGRGVPSPRESIEPGFDDDVCQRGVQDAMLRVGGITQGESMPCGVGERLQAVLLE